MIELVYVYIGEANNENYDLHFDFSRDTQVRWDNHAKKFGVIKIESELPNDFFPKNITDMVILPQNHSN